MNSVTIEKQDNPTPSRESHPLLRSYLHELYQLYQQDTDGTVANHLPELAQADPNWFGLCAVTNDAAVVECIVIAPFQPADYINDTNHRVLGNNLLKG